ENRNEGGQFIYSPDLAKQCLQKKSPDVKQFGFKNKHTPANAPLVPGFGLERWGGRKTKTTGEVPCLTLL
ncbi:MAG: hypothetical protein KKG34_00240, partial [Proteobacteria bacterium]|nr:hypothetical protein [Pseudomonadota bacterium]